MRLFIAVDIAEDIKPKIISLQKQLAEIADVKLVEPENLHFTMKFLGEVPDENIKYIEESVSQEIRKHTQFFINIKSIGVFPNERYIRVVWLGTDSHELAALQRVIDSALAQKFPPEKDVKPHLTLARVRTGRQNTEIMKFVKSHEALNVGAMKVSDVKLKKSILSPHGPTYEDVRIFELSP